MDLEAVNGADGNSVPVSNTTPSSKAKLYVLTFFVFLNAFITPSGVIYGWIGLEDQLKKEGQFSSGCAPKNTTSLDVAGHLLRDDVKCTSQDNSLANIYAVAANVASVGTVVYGVTLDYFGVRSNAVSGCLLNMLGWILLAYSDSSSFNAFIPAYSLIAFGGIGTYLAGFQFSNLYSRPTVILSAQSACFGAAGLLFVLFGFLYDRLFRLLFV
jgi:LAT3 family solute carrier family 43 protein 3